MNGIQTAYYKININNMTLENQEEIIKMMLLYTKQFLKDKLNLDFKIKLELVVKKNENYKITKTETDFIESVKTICANRFKTSVWDIESKTRIRKIVDARAIAMHIIHEKTNMSLKNIGMHFGGRDHSTIIHACNKVDDILKTEVDFKSKYELIIFEIKKLNSSNKLSLFYEE